MLLDIVGEIEPLGSNMWASVHEEYKKWAENSGYRVRDRDTLKQKFDRLANEKKPTGSARCPSPVLRAKQIARNILGRAQATALGGGDESDEGYIELT